MVDRSTYDSISRIEQNEWSMPIARLLLQLTYSDTAVIQA